MQINPKAKRVAIIVLVAIMCTYLFIDVLGKFGIVLLTVLIVGLMINAIKKDNKNT